MNKWECISVCCFLTLVCAYFDTQARLVAKKRRQVFAADGLLSVTEGLVSARAHLICAIVQLHKHTAQTALHGVCEVLEGLLCKTVRTGFCWCGVVYIRTASMFAVMHVIHARCSLLLIYTCTQST